MIYTLTLNPAIDYFMSYKDNPTGVQKTNEYEYLPGGKGINASIVLNNLGIPNKAIVVAGSLMGSKLLSLMEKAGIDYVNIKTEAETRMNVKSNFNGETIEQNSTGSKVNSKEINNGLTKLINDMTNKDTLMIMGSLPVGYSFDDLEFVVKAAHDKNIKLVFDLSRDHLSKLVKYQPEVIKPNRAELSELFGVEIKTQEDAMKYSKKLHENGAKRVLVSFDKSGSIYYDGTNEYYIKGYPITEVNGSGAGDSMISAFIAGLESNLNIEEILKLASGAGTATAASKGIANKEKIMHYKNKIETIGGTNV